ncbi:MAG: hypothetical protein JWP84_2457 [Tardiphaga sp.]|nr:hypothetical protein [Tardiphaga sp.]
MSRSSWTPSIVPSGWDQNVYLVVDCDRHGACVWTEAYVEATDLETVIADLMSGHYRDRLIILRGSSQSVPAGITQGVEAPVR